MISLVWDIKFRFLFKDWGHLSGSRNILFGTAPVEVQVAIGLVADWLFPKLKVDQKGVKIELKYAI